MDKLAMQVEGIKYLYDMEMVHHPQLINNLKLNIYSLSKNIKKVELLVLQEQKSMVVYYEMNLIGRLFTKYKYLNSDIEERFHQLLPEFRLRVVNDSKTFHLILNKAKEYLLGKKFYSDIPPTTSLKPIDGHRKEEKKSGENSIEESSSDNQETEL